MRQISYNRLIVLKQYGERRTGTNYLRAFLMANYCNALVLMHVLGDKHSPAVNFYRHWRDACSQSNQLFYFLKSATWAVPAETTCTEDPNQLAHLHLVATLLPNHFHPDQLGFLISTKNPYAWAVSLARYSHWLEPSGDDLKIGMAHRDSLEIACRLYNERHQAWIELHHRFKNRSFIVRHESLLEEPHATISALERRFGLIRLKSEPVFIRSRTSPTHWDNHPITFELSQFNPNFYREWTYRRFLDTQMLKVIQDTIDWDLAGEFGYRKH